MSRLSYIFGCIILFPFFSVRAVPSDTTSVFFIGNSLTYYYQLPDMFAQLAKSLGKTVSVEKSTFGGYSLQDHLATSATCSLLTLRRWTYVVLQENSIIPTIEYYRRTSMTPAARSLDSLARTIGAETVLFMTWGRKNGGTFSIGEHSSPTFSDFFQLQDTLNNVYTALANELAAGLCPVGMAWKLAFQESRLAPLWEDADGHPSLAGTYLAACTFYATLFHENPAGARYTAGLSLAEAASYQRLANTATKRYILNAARFVVYQNYPNPFHDRTTVSYSIPQRGRVTIGLYSMLGRCVATVATKGQPVGTYDVEFYASGLASGIYVYRIMYEGHQQSKKMIVLK